MSIDATLSPEAATRQLWDVVVIGAVGPKPYELSGDRSGSVRLVRERLCVEKLLISWDGSDRLIAEFRSRHVGVEGRKSSLSIPLVDAEKEEFVLQDRSAYRAAKLVEDFGRPGAQKGISRIEHSPQVILKQAAMNIVGSTLGDRVYDAAS